MAKKIWFNVLAVFAGLAGGTIGFWIGKFLLVNVLGKIPFIPKLLSWPVEYEWYAMIGIISLSLWGGLWPCGKLCNLAKTKYNYGLVVWGVFNVIYYIVVMVTNFSLEGFSFSMLILYLITIAGYIIFTLSGISGDIDLE